MVVEDWAAIESEGPGGGKDRDVLLGSEGWVLVAGYKKKDWCHGLCSHCLKPTWNGAFGWVAILLLGCCPFLVVLFWVGCCPFLSC